MKSAGGREKDELKMAVVKNFPNFHKNPQLDNFDEFPPIFVESSSPRLYPHSIPWLGEICDLGKP